MFKELAFRVSRDYGQHGATGLFVVQCQQSNDYNWHNRSWYGTEERANETAVALAALCGVTAYDIGGYELRG